MLIGGNCKNSHHVLVALLGAIIKFWDKIYTPAMKMIKLHKHYMCLLGTLIPRVKKDLNCSEVARPGFGHPGKDYHCCH